MKLEQMYQDIILDHYKNPVARGLREPYEIEVSHVNPSCGDEITLRIHLDLEERVVRDVSYDAQGCSISQASTSVLAEQIIGMNIEEAFAMIDAYQEMISSRGTVDGDEDIIGDGIAFAGVAKYPARVKCALLGWMACKDAMTQALDKHTCDHDHDHE